MAILHRLRNQLFTALSTRNPRKKDIAACLPQKAPLYIFSIDVLNRASVVVKGIGSNANQSGRQFLESIRYASIGKLQEPSVRVVGLGVVCGEIVSSRALCPIDFQWPKNKKASLAEAFLLPCMCLYCIGHFDAMSSYPPHS